MDKDTLGLLADSASGRTAAEAERRRTAERDSNLPAPAVNLNPDNAARLARRERLRKALDQTMNSRTARPGYQEWLADPNNAAAVGEESDRIAGISERADGLKFTSYGAKDNFIGRALIRTGSTAFTLSALSPPRTDGTRRSQASHPECSSPCRAPCKPCRGRRCSATTASSFARMRSSRWHAWSSCAKSTFARCPCL